MYKPAKPVKNIIVGAGPAGIQLAYFFEKAGIEYVILERNALAGSFFDRYPLSGQLISINKRYTGSDEADFNMRHDWNSLLSDDGPKFTDYSKDYYPDPKDLVRYMNDFATKYKLNIKYNHKVEKIKKLKDGGYALAVNDTSGKWVYRCDKLIIATGLGAPTKENIIDNTKGRVKHYSEYESYYFKKPENLVKFENKSVLIIGNGNAAYEIANVLNNVCSSINILGRSEKQWAATTHYTGDLRSIYVQYYDTALLKSLNSHDIINRDMYKGICSIEENPITKKLSYGPYSIGEKRQINKYTSGVKDDYDNVILCTGWKFDTSIFDFQLVLTPNDKYPLTTPNYECYTHENLFFIGSLMHAHDYKKSSGGFIHGFRYLIEHFFHLNYDHIFSYHIFRYPDFNSIVDHILFKINRTSPMYQMYGQICDMFIFNPVSAEFVYYNNVTQPFLSQLNINPSDIIFVLDLEYGTRMITETTKLGQRSTESGNESSSVLLHPVIRVLKLSDTGRPIVVEQVHFEEDLLAIFNHPRKYRDRILRTIKAFC